MPIGLIVAIGAIVFVVIAIVAFIASRLKIADPNEALIVSGSKADGDLKVVQPGGKVFVVPFLQRCSRLSLQTYNITLEVAGYDKNSIPVNVIGIAMVKVGSQPNFIRAAAERFSEHEESIVSNVEEVLSGTLRATIGNMTVDKLITDRAALSNDVTAAAENDLEIMGIVLDTLQIKDISDRNGYIQALSVPEVESVKRNARIAKANANKEANEAEVESGKLIAQQDKELQVRQAEMAQEVLKAKAVSEAAGEIAKAEQQKIIFERQQEAASANALLRERELESEVRKPADAEKYKVEIAAQAEKARMVALAEADAKKQELEGFAQAEVIRKKGEAEGLAMEKKADALQKYGEAASLQMIIEALPKIAAEIAQAYAAVGELTIVSTDGATAPTKAVADNFSQLNAVVEGLTGKSINDLAKGLIAK